MAIESDLLGFQAPCINLPRAAWTPKTRHLFSSTSGCHVILPALLAVAMVRKNQHKPRRQSRKLKRLDALTRSPIFAWFSDSRVTPFVNKTLAYQVVRTEEHTSEL